MLLSAPFEESPAYGLNVWLRSGGKVLLLHWREGAEDEFEITTFKRGDWEEKFLKLSAAEAGEAVHSWPVRRT